LFKIERIENKNGFKIKAHQLFQSSKKEGRGVHEEGRKVEIKSLSIQRVSWSSSMLKDQATLYFSTGLALVSGSLMREKRDRDKVEKEDKRSDGISPCKKRGTSLCMIVFLLGLE
jgi:hypothetical protein